MNSRHAYLIMAHADPEHLQQLVSAIDDYRNDIFIHLDLKSDILKFNTIESTKSKLKFIDNRIDVRWGDPTQIYAEYELLKFVNRGGYNRIHLLSGADYPLKSQDFIHDFFAKHSTDEFIDFEDETTLTGELRKKMRLYNLFLPLISNHNKTIAFLFGFLRRVLLVIQMAFGINRRYTIDNLKKGSQWVSITQAFANELLKHETEIKNEYRLTHCCDEIYKQTIAWNCGFKERISPLGNMRLIDFARGNGRSPYTFKESDLTELRASTALFARKFSSEISGNLTTKLISK